MTTKPITSLLCVYVCVAQHRCIQDVRSCAYYTENACSRLVGVVYLARQPCHTCVTAHTHALPTRQWLEYINQEQKVLNKYNSCYCKENWDNWMGMCVCVSTLITLGAQTVCTWLWLYTMYSEWTLSWRTPVSIHAQPPCTNTTTTSTICDDNNNLNHLISHSSIFNGA